MPNREGPQTPNEGGDVDWVVLTAIPEEFLAFVEQLDRSVAIGRFPVPAKVGMIAGSRVLCVLSGKGGAATATVLSVVVRDTRADKVLLVGIAGGFPAQKMNRGDVIIAKTIMAYDFGKLVDGNYIRRPDMDWQCDPGLVGYAMLAAGKRWFDRIKAPRPDKRSATASTVRDGYAASGDKVIDDDEHPFFREATIGIAEIHAVEMESAGAGAAVRFLQMMDVVRFLMIKGISDEPHGTAGVDQGTAQRGQWKKYAAEAAAALACGLIEEMAPDQITRPSEFGPAPRERRTRDDALEIAALYRRFRSDWWPDLPARQQHGISIADTIDWLLRSLVPAFESEPALMKALKARAWDSRLPPHLPEEEEAAIRRLRNLGLVQHDGKWLFTPTRSKVVEPTPAGRLLIALLEGADRTDRQEITGAVVRELLEISHDVEAIALLKAVDEGRKIPVRDKDAIRRLRSLHLVAHEEEFLESAESVRITGLGRYLLRSMNS